MSQPGSATKYRHPVNQQLVEEAPRGDRIADRVTAFMGSWKFIIIQTIVVSIWVLGNIYLYFNFDHFPFILLNLAFSLEAAYTAPLILLAGNRSHTRSDELSSGGQEDRREPGCCAGRRSRSSA
jgi:uncharacterized membrane protein